MFKCEGSSNDIQDLPNSGSLANPKIILAQHALPLSNSSTSPPSLHVLARPDLRRPIFTLRNSKNTAGGKRELDLVAYVYLLLAKSSAQKPARYDQQEMRKLMMKSHEGTEALERRRKQVSERVIRFDAAMAIRDRLPLERVITE